MWRATLEMQGQYLPFNFSLDSAASGWQLTLLNADERLPIGEVEHRGDSMIIPMHIFDAELRLAVQDTVMRGVYRKNFDPYETLPFTANYGYRHRFETSGPASADLTGKWEAAFAHSEGDEHGVGVFQQQGNQITGTFLFPTGDYRYLEGTVSDSILKMSAFDGTHAFLFHGKVTSDGTLEGDFWSGAHWHQRWWARRNEAATLPDPYMLTTLKKGHDKLRFVLPNSDSVPVSLTDDRYADKPVIVQIMGTWCPNCMDETRFLADWYARQADRSVEVIALAFERNSDFDYGIRRIEKVKEQLNVEYEILYAGSKDSVNRARTLPMLTQIVSFPTTIFLDRAHRVVSVHTGFAGPGTGEYYQQFVAEFYDLVDQIQTGGD
jgi:thiol-disulfide isomerase/thioredoxin